MANIKSEMYKLIHHKFIMLNSEKLSKKKFHTFTNIFFDIFARGVVTKIIFDEDSLLKETLDN